MFVYDLCSSTCRVALGINKKRVKIFSELLNVLLTVRIIVYQYSETSVMRFSFLCVKN
jgi:predicted nucleic acid-binding Zn ribbon protein